MKRIELKTNWAEFQATAVVQVEDEVGSRLLKEGRGRLAPQQEVYAHIDQMPPKLQAKSLAALEAADQAGGFRDQAARAAATAPWRDK